MKRKPIAAVFCALLALVLSSCRTADEAPAVTEPAEPAETAVPEEIPDLRAAMQGFAEAIAGEEFGGSFPAYEAGSTAPFIRAVRNADPGISDAQQYLEETVMAHFEEEFRDMITEKSPLETLIAKNGSEAALIEYTAEGGEALVHAAFACVSEEDAMIILAAVFDNSSPADIHILLDDAFTQD